MIKKDVVVIGAGIAGLTSAIYLKRANVDFVILENLLPGGKLNILKDVENYPGFDKCSGKDILFSLMNQIRKLDIQITYGSVVNVLKDEYGFKIVTDKEIYLTKALIVASGIKQEDDSIIGEKEFFGRGVSYCATCDGNFFKNKTVCVYGNNDTALEEALYLSNIVKKLIFVCNDENLFGDQSLISNLNKDNVVIYKNSSIKEIVGDMFGVTGIVLNNNELIDVDGVFPYVGKKSASIFLNNLNLTFNKGFISVDKNMQSEINGLFAAGDIADGPIKQLVTAASDGAIASTSAIRFIRKK